MGNYRKFNLWDYYHITWGRANEHSGGGGGGAAKAHSTPVEFLLQI